MDEIERIFVGVAGGGRADAAMVSHLVMVEKTEEEKRRKVVCC